MKFKVNEVFHSIQGEGARIGRPCLFIRLTGCPLRCSYCDTEYAFYDGAMRELGDLLDEVRRRLGPPRKGPSAPFVELTGGEPLAHPHAPDLLQALLDQGYEVALETAGSHDLAPIPRAVVKIVDRKTPGSGEAHRWLESNLDHMVPGQDELKFVLCGEADYEPVFGPWISECAAQFIPCVSEAVYHRRYQEPDKLQDDGTEIDWPIPYWWVDIGATMQNVMLAAVDEGLGCGFVGAAARRGRRAAAVPRDPGRVRADRGHAGRAAAAGRQVTEPQARLVAVRGVRPLGALVDEVAPGPEETGARRGWVASGRRSRPKVSGWRSVASPAAPSSTGGARSFRCSGRPNRQPRSKPHRP